MKKKLSIALVLAAMVAGNTMMAYAGEWEKTETGTRYIENGAYVTGWKWIPAYWDYLDLPGEGEWCYYFGEDGYLWTGTTTPDGNQVTGSGSWTCNSYIMNRRDGVVYYGGTDKVYDEVTRRAREETERELREYYASQDVEGGKAVDAWFGYTPDTVPKSSNDFLHGFYGQLTPNQKVEMKNAIIEFMEKYIRDDMSDFEKEITIARWLVDHCEYELRNVTAYQAIVQGKAQCAGYADAFLQMGKACGLEVRYVYNEDHAWNLIQLDGEWYHVDLTYEDSPEKNSYNFDHLQNKYINLDDETIRHISKHQSWDAHGIEANGQKYGREAVAEYLN